MITDEERREVVARLREWLAIPWYERPWSRDAMQSLGKMVGAVPGENIVERIADLIDRPTCTNQGDDWTFLCSNCGECVTITKKIPCGVAESTYRPYFCPGCGAEVVDE